MAKRAHALATRIESLAWDIHMQVLKLCLFPDSPDRNHWLSKLEGYLISIHVKIRSSNDYPEASFYEKRLFFASNEDADYCENLLTAWRLNMSPYSDLSQFHLYRIFLRYSVCLHLRWQKF